MSSLRGGALLLANLSAFYAIILGVRGRFDLLGWSLLLMATSLGVYALTPPEDES